MLTTNDIVFTDGVQEYLDKCKRIAEESKQIFLFGSARGGEKVYSYLSMWGVSDRVLFVADNDKMKQGNRFHGVSIIGARDMVNYLSEYKEAQVIVASGSAHIIMNQLERMGVKKDRLHSFAFTMLQTDPTPYEYFCNNMNLIQSVYDILSDDKSKDVYISLINYKMTMNDAWLKDIADNEHEQYFDEIMNLTEHEAFADCGAYVGDTLDEYDKKMHGKWDMYYLIEADPDVYEKMKILVRNRGYDRVECINMGCWDKKETLRFKKLGSGSSQITDEGFDVEIRAETLDSILAKKPVTIIKMDIEGAEQNALKGACGVIAAKHPKLAISNYHSMDDFLQIPMLLKRYSNDYNIYMRHYRRLSDSETICYAV